MAGRGDSYYNPASNTQLVFVELPRENGGERLVLDWFVAAEEALVSAGHYHAGPDGFVSERFDLIKGSAVCRIGAQVVRAEAPHIFEIPCNTVHVHPRNVGDDEMHVRQSILLPQPDLLVMERAERFFETVAALAQQGKVNRRGDIINPLQSTLTLHDTLLDPTWLPLLPQSVQRAVFGAGAAVARALGYQAYHRPERERPSRRDEAHDRPLAQS